MLFRCMKQARIVVRAVLLVGLCFLEASGSLRQHRLKETCKDLSNASLGEDYYPLFSFSENTRCLIAGGKYCTANMKPIVENSGSFKYVGPGCCYDWDGERLESVSFLGQLTVEDCASKCISASKEIGSTLRGFERSNTEDKADCYCLFDDDVISSNPAGASSYTTESSGKGEVKASTKYDGCELYYGQCWRYLSKECPSYTTPPSDDSFIRVGDGCCQSADNKFYDFAYYAYKISKEECESRCISVMDEISSPLRGFMRDSTEEKADCYCIFDDGVISYVPDCVSSVWTDNSGVDEVKSSTKFDGCGIYYGECWRYESTRRVLENRTSDSSADFVTACMSTECDTEHDFFLDGTRVDSSAVLTEVSCLKSTCTSFEVGKNRPFNDIATVPATDPSDCCDACHKESGCKLFSWSWLENLCYLKDAQGDTLDDMLYITGNI
jgi:hypothetical protein